MSKSCVDSRRYSNKWNTQWWKCIYIYLEKIGGWLFTSGCPATSYQACLLQRLRYSNNASKFMCIICFITFRIAGTNSRIDRWNHDARNLLSAHFFFSSSLSGFPLFVTRFLFLGVIFSASLIRAYLKLITFVIIVHIKESWATIEMKRHQSIKMRRAREFHCTEMQNKRRKTHTLPYFMSCWNRYLNGLKLKCSRWWRDKRARSHYKHFIMARKCLPLKNQATTMTASTPATTHTHWRGDREKTKRKMWVAAARISYTKSHKISKLIGISLKSMKFMMTAHW